MTKFDFKAIGTSWRIDIEQKLAPQTEAELRSRIMARIDIFDRAYSRFRADSQVTQMSQKAGTYELPADAAAMMDIYRKLYDLTDGLMTPLIGNLISDAGYDAQYSLQKKERLSSPPAWDEAIEFKPPILTVKKPVMLDFGAAGKGYLVDLVGQVLMENGVDEFCIDAGGDILHKGKAAQEKTGSAPVRIGLENPHDAKQVIGVCDLKNQSICGSAGNRRAWGDFTHIINPKTLSSPRHIAAVWVVAETALVADALATALFFISPRSLLGEFQFEYVIINSDSSFEKSAGFQGEIFAA